MAAFPTTDVNTYHEIFLGGGSVLFSVLAHLRAGRIRILQDVRAYDINEPLIWVYKNIQTHPKDLYSIIQSIVDEFIACPEEGGVLNRAPSNIGEAIVCRENYYYWSRIRYNALSPQEKCGLLGSALFIFLNKTCFRGVFRVGPRGFNVPYGHYANPTVATEEHLLAVHDLIQGVHFECLDFNDSLSADRISPGDYVYLDPPYSPKNKTSFVGYTEKGFNGEAHMALFDRVHALTVSNACRITMSNADVVLVRQFFESPSAAEHYAIQSLSCKRAIHSKTPSARATEVIITNFSREI